MLPRDFRFHSALYLVHLALLMRAYEPHTIYDLPHEFLSAHHLFGSLAVRAAHVLATLSAHGPLANIADHWSISDTITDDAYALLEAAV